MKRIILLLLLLISIQGFSQTQDNRTPVGTITPYIPMPGFNLDSVRLLGSMWTGASWATRTFYGADIIRYGLKKSDTGWLATQAWVQDNFPTIQRFLDSLSAVRSAVGTGNSGGNASSVPWSGITSTPTTLQGYNLLGDAYTKGQIDATFAPLYSPALAGTPTGPTAVAGSSNNQLATTAFVQNAVAASSTGVSSFNGRGGAVSPLSGDYSSFYPILSGSYANPSWITSLAWSKITGATALDSTNAPALHSVGFYDNRYLVPINANTASISSNTTSINSILSYYNGSVIKPTSLPIGSPSALGAYKVGSGLAVDVSGVLSATGTQFSLNNIQMFGAAYSSSQTFSLPNTPTRVYYVQVWNNSVPMTIPYSAWSLTGNSLTVSSSLSAGDSVVAMYDIGTANGTIASGTPQTGYVPVYQANGSVLWAAQTGGSSGGPTSITLATPNVLYSTPITYTNDGSGNWSGTLSLISQAAHKVFASPLASTGTPIFRYIDSSDFGATGQFAAEVQAVPGFGSGSSGGVTTVGPFNSSSYTNGANISTNTITFGPADLVNPGMVTAGTQSFGGIKSWFNKQVGLSATAGYGYSFFPDINVTSGTTRGVWIAGYDSSSTGGTRLVFDVGTTNAAQGGGTYTSALKIGTDGSITTGIANTTIGGPTQFTSNFGTSFSAQNANFFVASSQGPTTATLTDASYFGTTTTSFHTNFAGSSPSVVAAPAGYNIFDVNIGTANMDVASTGGTHPLAAAMAIDTPYIRDPGFGTRGTVARVATLYINGAPLKNAMESSQPFSLWIGGTGVFRNDNGVIPGARTTVADANYTLSINDFNVVFTSLTATRSITPPANPQTNQHWKIKDEAGTAGTNNITFVGTLDGATNPAIISTNSGAKTIYWNGTAWFTE